MGSMNTKKAKKASNVSSGQSKVNVHIELFKFLERQERMQKVKQKFYQQSRPTPKMSCGKWIKSTLRGDDFSALSHLCENKIVFLEDMPEFRCGIPARGEVYRVRLDLYDINYLEYDGRNKLSIHRFRLLGNGICDIVNSLQSGTSKLNDHIKFLTERISKSLNDADFFVIHDDGKIKFSERKSLKGIYSTLRFRYPGDNYQRIIIYFPHIQKASIIVKRKGKPYESSTFFWYPFYDRDEQANASDAILGFNTTTDSF